MRAMDLRRSMELRWKRQVFIAWRGQSVDQRRMVRAVGVRIMQGIRLRVWTAWRQVVQGRADCESQVSKGCLEG